MKISRKSKTTYNWAVKQATTGISAAEARVTKVTEKLEGVKAERERAIQREWDTYYLDLEITRLEEDLAAATSALREAVRVRPQWERIVEQYEAVL